jgi:hypothetical protein
MALACAGVIVSSMCSMSMSATFAAAVSILFFFVAIYKRYPLWRAVRK